MRSICKNCCHSQRDGEHLFCGVKMKYVADDETCSEYGLPEGEDSDVKVMLIAGILIVFILMLVGLCS